MCISTTSACGGPNRISIRLNRIPEEDAIDQACRHASSPRPALSIDAECACPNRSSVSCVRRYRVGHRSMGRALLLRATFRSPHNLCRLRAGKRRRTMTDQWWLWRAGGAALDRRAMYGRLAALSLCPFSPRQCPPPIDWPRAACSVRVGGWVWTAGVRRKQQPSTHLRAWPSIRGTETPGSPLPRTRLLASPIHQAISP